MSSDFRFRYIVPVLLGLAQGKAFLDVACGFGKWGDYIRNQLNPSSLVGIDIWKPYLVSVKRKKIYDDLILADSAFLPIRKEKFDVCVLCDVIEHLDKEKGIEMLNSAENLASKAVVVSTPNYHYLQDAARGNPFEKHVCFWSFKDFQQRGYKVFGIGFYLNKRIILGGMPVVRKIFARVILKDRLLRFAEQFAMIKHVS